MSGKLVFQTLKFFICQQFKFSPTNPVALLVMVNLFPVQAALLSTQMAGPSLSTSSSMPISVMSVGIAFGSEVCTAQCASKGTSPNVYYICMYICNQIEKERQL